MLVVHLAASSCVGGPESQILGSLGSLPDGAGGAVLSFSEGGRCRPLLAEARKRGAEGIELVENAPNYRAAISEVAGHLRRLNAGLLCCHGYKPDIMGFFAARRAGVPVVSVSHGWTAATFKVRLNEAVDRLCLHGMDRIVCVSEAQGRRVRRLGVSRSRVVVIPNAIDPARYLEDDPTGREALLSLFPKPPRRLVGSAGRLSPEKGYGVLVEAAAIVGRENRDIGFVHFGVGPLQADLTQRVHDLGLGDRFVFAGFRTDLHRVYRHLDLFTLPSYTEGLPVVVLEAQASGVPVVATAVGGTPEVIVEGETGRLIPPGNPKILAERIIETLANEVDRRAMGERGRRRVLDHFTFDVQRAAYQDLFEGLTRPNWRGVMARL